MLVDPSAREEQCVDAALAVGVMPAGAISSVSHLRSGAFAARRIHPALELGARVGTQLWAAVGEALASEAARDKANNVAVPQRQGLMHHGW